MNKKELIINIIGKERMGKTTLAYVLKSFLESLGAEVEISSFFERRSFEELKTQILSNINNAKYDGHKIYIRDD